ncbi:hypothetical protein CB1_060782009 [Camelus ferus]|nr:hypothetical protein CB1_060782009 [Camelus ferus]
MLVATGARSNVLVKEGSSPELAPLERLHRQEPPRAVRPEDYHLGRHGLVVAESAQRRRAYQSATTHGGSRERLVTGCVSFRKWPQQTVFCMFPFLATLEQLGLKRAPGACRGD